MTNKNREAALEPRLIVKGAAEAIDFYKKALGAEEVSRFAAPNLGGHIVHAELAVRGQTFSLTEEHKEWDSIAPTTLNGSPVMMHLSVDDVDALGERMVAAGAEVVITIADQFYGAREGRLRDPFGHLWILSQTIEELSTEEINKRMADFGK